MITLQDAKDQLNITDTTHDNEIQVYVDATTGAVERLRGEVIDPRQVTDEFDLGYVSSFMLNNVPVLSLTSVTRIDGSITWDLASLH
ncbi:MAG: phage head-tail connector protein, partial [Sciscionella sp.]